MKKITFYMVIILLVSVSFISWTLMKNKVEKSTPERAVLVMNIKTKPNSIIIIK